jgi:hypothetical protein
VKAFGKLRRKPTAEHLFDQKHHSLACYSYFHAADSHGARTPVNAAAPAPLARDPEKWTPVFGQDHAPPNTQRCATFFDGMPSIGHSSVPTVGRVIASTISRVPSGSVIHFL